MSVTYKIEITSSSYIFWTKNSVDKPCKALFDLIMDDADWKTGEGLSINWINQFNAQIVVDNNKYNYIRVTEEGEDADAYFPVKYFVVDSVAKNLKGGGYVLNITLDVFCTYCLYLLDNDVMMSLSVKWVRGSSLTFYAKYSDAFYNCLDDELLVWESYPICLVSSINMTNSEISLGQFTSTSATSYAIGQVINGKVANKYGNSMGSGNWQYIFGAKIKAWSYYSFNNALCPSIWLLQLSSGLKYGFMQFSSNEHDSSSLLVSKYAYTFLPIELFTPNSNYNAPNLGVYTADEQLQACIDEEVSAGAVFLGRFPFPFFMGLITYAGQKTRSGYNQNSNNDWISDLGIIYKFDKTISVSVTDGSSTNNGGSLGYLGICFQGDLSQFCLDNRCVRYNGVIIPGSSPTKYEFKNPYYLYDFSVTINTLHPYLINNLKIPGTNRIKYFRFNSSSSDLSYYTCTPLYGYNSSDINKDIYSGMITFSEMSLNIFSAWVTYKDSYFSIPRCPSHYDSYSDYIKSVKSQQNASLLSGFNNMIAGTIGKGIAFGGKGAAYGAIQGTTQFVNNAISIAAQRADAKRSSVAVNVTSDIEGENLVSMWLQNFSSTYNSSAPSNYAGWAGNSNWMFYANAVPVYYPVNDYQARELTQAVLWNGFYYNTSTDFRTITSYLRKWANVAGAYLVNKSSYRFFVLLMEIVDMFSFKRLRCFYMYNEEMIEAIRACFENLIRLWSQPPLGNELEDSLSYPYNDNCCDWNF